MLDFFDIDEVAVKRFTGTAGFLDGLNSFVGAGFIRAVADDDVGPFFGEGDRNRLSDTAVCPVTMAFLPSNFIIALY